MMSPKSFLSAIVLTFSLPLSPAFAGTVDGEPILSPTSDSGLYVWRTASGKWQARYLAGSAGSQQFAGTFTTARSISSLQRIILEGADDAHVGPADTLHVDLHVSGTDIDGVAFTVTGNGSLCLSKPGARATVYLGANATPASTPVSLQGSDACAAESAETRDGLYFNAVGNNSWEVRQISETERQQFSGTLAATQPIQSFQQVSIESGDNAYKSSATTITMNLNSAPGWLDGFNFKLAAGAGACLRDSAGPGSVVFIGSGPGDAVAATTPVDLTNSGACGGSAGSRKTNAGHYVAMMRSNDSQSEMSAAINAGVKGFMKRYTWKSLEPVKGSYDFSEIASDLAFLAGQGMHLVVMIEDKTFVDERPTPDYLRDNTRRNMPGGWTAVRWNPYVVARMNALAAALGARFDSHPYFEGIAMQESAPGLNDATADATGYSPEAYRDSLINYLTSATRSLPKSRVFWFMNFLPGNQGYLADIASAVSNTGVVMGGPDVMPDNWPLQYHTYPLYREFAGKLPLFGQIEPICYAHEHSGNGYPTKYWTMTELFFYARNNLHTDYLFWVPLPKGKFYNSYDFNDALPVISRYADFSQ